MSTQAELKGGAGADGALAAVATLSGTRVYVPTDKRKGAALQSVHGRKNVVFVDGRGGGLTKPRGQDDEAPPTATPPGSGRRFVLRSSLLALSS